MRLFLAGESLDGQVGGWASGHRAGMKYHVLSSILQRRTLRPGETCHLTQGHAAIQGYAVAENSHSYLRTRRRG